MQEKLKVMIVDDEVHSIAGIDELLTYKGYPSKIFSNPAEALSAFEQEHYDVILTDLQMPGITGIDLMLTAKQKKPDTYVMIMTNYADIDSVIDAYKKGAFQYFRKPLDLSELIDSLITIEKEKEKKEQENELKRLVEEYENKLQKITGAHS